MSLGIPFVQFDLVEGRKVAGDAALYATGNSPVDLARQMGRLIDDPALRARLSEEGRVRSTALLRWDTERGRLLAAYERALLSGRRPTHARVPIISR
jgi:glycosyltransferase involved in cell wall biosynthesis